MATYTTNLNLEKPATSENFNLSKINSNWDKIDAGYGSVDSALGNCNIVNTTVSSGTPKSFTVANSSRGMFFFCGAASAYMGMYIFATTSSGDVIIKEISAGGSGVTIDTATANKITISTNSVFRIVFLVSAGSVTA